MRSIKINNEVSMNTPIKLETFIAYNLLKGSITSMKGRKRERGMEEERGKDTTIVKLWYVLFITGLVRP